MTDPTWDPQLYLRYADERSRPFVDLTARIAAAGPDRVVDLGCGPGQLTASLTERWPAAQVLGIDSSPTMIASAQELAAQTGLGTERLAFRRADLREVDPAAIGGPVEVVVSNATLQWVPEHRTLFGRLLELVQPSGWFAFQVPGNFDAPSHRLLRDLAAEAPYAEHTDGTARVGEADPEQYLADLSALGCTVDAWETTYLHVLTGPDPVFTWVSGTGARPVLQALPDALRPGFVEEYKARLRQAYPAQPFGTVLPFRRVFVVAQRTVS